MDVSLSKQRLDIDEAIQSLNSQKYEIEHKITVLKSGFEALGNGEDILTSKSILAQEVQNIMRSL